MYAETGLPAWLHEFVFIFFVFVLKLFRNKFIYLNNMFVYNINCKFAKLINKVILS